MNNYFQDIVTNFIILFTAWFVARFSEKRKYFYFRMVLCFLGYCILRYVYFYQIVPLFGKNLYELSKIIGFIFLIVLAIVASLFCYKLSFWSALYCSTLGYCVQHICHKTYRLIAFSLMRDVHVFWHYFLFIALVLLLLLLVVLLVIRWNIRQIEVENKHVFILSVVVVLVDIYLEFERNLTTYQVNNIIGILLTCTVFILLIAILSNKRLKNERNLLREILKEEREQYLFEKTMIDMVNMKCHDLKHQIAMLSNAPNQELSEQVQSVIEAYDSRFNTGNVALDVVLTRKNFSCKEKKIELTCMAYGKALETFAETDVYSLFGNILDNAIEATEKIEDESRRIISLVVQKRDRFIFIHSENYYVGKLNFAGGLPLTTKGDVILHGYGMKSIRTIVEEYGGSMKISTKEERFILEIVIPL